MNYLSTRGRVSGLTAEQVILKGLAQDGGLFVPSEIPKLSATDLACIGEYSYTEAAVYILSRFLPTFSISEIHDCVCGAYGEGFDSELIAPLRLLKSGKHVLELWHGPTAAFKDMALQLLPRLLTASARKTGASLKTAILTATSGDTGKAALAGFCDVPDTKIIVFYPKNGVSAVQERQMITQEGQNVCVCAVEGNFDDAQNAVKTLFADESLAKEAEQAGYAFSSANSINWGRLAPQIVYYAHASAKMLAHGFLEEGEKITFVVPTGNFGNILACYYAKCMGAPIGKIVCASNKNDVLTEFLTTGVYDRNRPFHKTLSPSMDILISSNLERLLFEVSGRDSAFVVNCMRSLAENGRYEIPAELLKKIKETFVAGCCDDEQTLAAVKAEYETDGYLADTHTAVAFHVLESVRAQLPENDPCVVVSTASPYKFAESVVQAILPESGAKGFEALSVLTETTGVPIPVGLRDLDKRPVLHNNVKAPSALREFVLEQLHN